MEGFSMTKPNIPINNLIIQKNILLHYVDTDYKLEAYDFMKGQYEYLGLEKKGFHNRTKLCPFLRDD